MYDSKKINILREFFLSKKLTIAAAESVTAGHLQAALSAATEASLFFQGGITTYNLGQKSRHLLVEPIHAEQANCVSEKVTEQMARHVNQLFLSDYGIAITGYAAPVPEKNIENLFAYFSVALHDKILLTKKITSSLTNSIDVQLAYVDDVLNAMTVLIKQP